jgi:hypothetical protein
MVLRIGWIALAATAGFDAAFFLYGMFRTIGPEFGFTARAACLAFGFVVAYAGFLPSAAYLTTRAIRNEPLHPVPLWLRVFGVALLAGCIASESWISWDESRFAGEVAASPAIGHDRPRAWPNDRCGFVYVPGSGIHTTD